MNKEFKAVPECQKYCKEHDLAFFRRDLNDTFAKICEANTFENIFNKIKSGNNSYYESWASDQKMKLYIDYDKKEIIDETSSEEIDVLSHKNDLYNIITAIREIIPEITNVYILKSIPDTTKKSYHLIFDGVYFDNYKIIKDFVEDKIKPRFTDLFKKKIIDTSVYAPKCFRSLLCTKYGQNRKLMLLKTEPFTTELREDIIHENNIDVDIFKKTCLTFITEGLVKYDYIKNDRHTLSEVKEEGDLYTDKEIIKKYLDILDTDRYTNYDKWLKIGFILYSINPKNKDLWHYFSAKWEGYNKDLVEQKWLSFTANEYIYTIHSLMYLARIDNITDYNEINGDIPDNDIRYLKVHDNILSKFIYRLYGELFVCSNPEKKEWYFFNGIRWVLDNKNYTLRKLISSEVYAKIESHIRKLKEDKCNESIIKNYNFILSKIGNGKELSCLELEFFNPLFFKMINQNKDLIGFNNGVYDLKTHQFRKGNPTDYITMTTGYDYKFYDKDDPLYIEVFTLLSQILPILDVKQFTLKSLSTCLDAYIREENFYIWSGKHNSGGNGKTTIMSLMELALGNYACTVPVSLFTTKRESANNANSALVSIIGTRLAIMSEPEASDMIQVSNMKSLTGGDTISTRDLNSRQMSFKPNSKFFMLCNKVPNLSSSDGGTLRRIKITEFVSKFVSEPKVRESDSNDLYEFKIDHNLKGKLQNYKDVFMCILIDYYKLYIQEGLLPPPDVVKVTQKYEDDNNHIKLYISENLCKTNHKDQFISKNDLKDMFKLDKNLLYTFKKFNVFANSLLQTLSIDFEKDSKNVERLPGWRFINEDDEDSD
jgi:P4 family phage/plasmid primase-like protien